MNLLESSIFSRSALQPLDLHLQPTASGVNNITVPQSILSDQAKKASKVIGAQHFNNFSNSLGKGVDFANIGFNLASGVGLFKPHQNSNTTETLNTAWDTASNFAGPFGPAMKAANLVTKIGQGLGVATDQMTTTDKIFDSTPGYLLGGWANAAFGKRANKTEFNREVIDEMGSQYGGLNNTFNNADKKSNKKYGVLSRGSRKKANRQIGEANRKMNVLSDIHSQASDDKESSRNQFNGMKNKFMTSGGWDQYSSGNAFLAKNGMKVKLNFANKVLANTQSLENTKQKFKDGGKVNVIPTGSLHAHLNHMQDKIDVTRKGIPVITKADGGSVVQHAEIEKEEIIFRLSVTEELEKLKEIGTDEAAIKAGKLLVHEILNNTDDNADLINKINI